MGAVFISHSSHDVQAARQMAAWLRDAGYDSLFLDVDPEAGLVAGKQWEQQLYARLRGCRAVIVLCSRASMSSRWCFAELTHARALGKPVFPVRLDDCDVHELLRGIEFVDLCAGAERACAQLLSGLRQVLGSRDLKAWDRTRSPYPGLLAFQEQDAPVFFGRDGSIKDTLAWLNRLNRFGGARLGLMLGASGCGKSSLLRAGVLPLLRLQPADWLVLEPFRPLRDPWAELIAAFQKSCERLGLVSGDVVDELRLASERPKSDAGAFSKLLSSLCENAKQPDALCLMIIDQLEEVLEGAATEPAGRFAAFLRALLEASDTPLMVLGTIRSDLLARFQLHPLGQVAFDQIVIGPLTLQGVALAIEEPARVAEITLEPGLVSQMVADTGTTDALPLLAFTLRELWERYADDGHLSLDEYRRELGGLQGSLARAADTVLGARRLRPGEEMALRRAFLALVRIDADGKYVRRQALWAELPPQSHDLLQRFVQNRLLVPRELNGESTLEVAHEALFRSWNKLRLWLDEAAASLRVRGGLQAAAAEWEGAGRQDELLVHKGSRLEAAELLRADPNFELSTLERAYLDTCLALREHERADHYVSCVMLSQRYVQSAEYELALDWLWQCPAAHRHWEWGYLMKLAYLELPAVSLGLVEHTSPARVEAPVSFDTLGWDWSNPDQPSLVSYAPNSGRAFSRDGRWSVTREPHEKVAHIRDTATGQAVLTLPTHADPILNASFSSDGERVATAAGKVAYVWERRTGRLLVTLRGHRKDVNGVTFSQDGKRLLTAGDDESARIWDAASGRELVVLKRTADWRFQPVDRSEAMTAYTETGGYWRAPAFSPDGSRIAVFASGECLLFDAYPFSDDTVAALPGATSRERFDAWRHLHDALRAFTLAEIPASGDADNRPVIDVRSAEELVRQIAPGRILRLTAGAVYDVGRLPNLSTKHARYHAAHDGQTLIVSDVSDLTIVSAEGAPASIITPCAYAFVLQFERCVNVRLEHVLCGHAPERGGCDRGVIGAIDSFRLTFADCDFYGSGTEGLTLTNVHGVRVVRTVVHDCTYGILSLDHATDVVFDACSFVNNEQFWGMRIKRSRDVVFRNCVIENNVMSGALFSFERSFSVQMAGGRIHSNQASALSDPDGALMLAAVDLAGAGT